MKKKLLRQLNIDFARVGIRIIPHPHGHLVLHDNKPIGAAQTTKDKARAQAITFLEKQASEQAFL